ncbi:MAG: hypothetical protein V1776_02265 [Candidatus Diapherotrites archaeon]
MKPSFSTKEAHPRILVGGPTCYLKHDSLNAFFAGLNALTYPNFDVVLEDNSPAPTYSEKIRTLAQDWEVTHPGRTFRVIYSGETAHYARKRLVNGRNKIRELVVREKYDYFLSLEQDVVPPANVIEALLHTEKDIVGATYYNKTPEKTLTIMAGTFENEEAKMKNIVRSMGFLELFPTRILNVAYVGLGCTLIARTVLEKVSFRYEEDKLASDDIYFCQDAREKGIETYLHTGMLCTHHFNDAFKQTKY